MYLKILLIEAFQQGRKGILGHQKHWQLSLIQMYQWTLETNKRIHLNVTTGRVSFEQQSLNDKIKFHFLMILITIHNHQITHIII